MRKIIKVILHPERIINKLVWKYKKRYFGKMGKKYKIGCNCKITGEKNIFIGENFFTDNNVKIETWEYYRGMKTKYTPKLIIGDNVTITEGCYISCLNQIEIGNGVLIGEKSFISDNSHGKNSIDEMDTIPVERKLWSKGKIKIGKNVWIGRNVCIMPNVEIGDNSVIGANAVVTHNLPPNSIAVGVPAKIIKNIE